MKWKHVPSFRIDFRLERHWPKSKPLGVSTTYLEFCFLLLVNLINLSHILNVCQHQDYTFSTAGLEASEVIQMGGTSLSLFAERISRFQGPFTYWVIATHELPLFLGPRLSLGIKTSHWNHYYSFSPQLFLFESKTVSSLFWQILFLQLQSTLWVM